MKFPYQSLFLGLAFTIGLFCKPVEAQITQEKTVELTGKSKKRGYLGDVKIDDNKQQFELVFVTSESNKKVNYEIFQFDYDFNLIKNYEDAERKTKNKRSKNKVYKGDYWEVSGVSANPSKTGKLVLKKTLYTYQWNWWRGGYEIQKSILDKEKPKEMDSEGNSKKKLLYVTHHELSEAGKLYAVGLVNPGMTYTKNGEREYTLLEIDTDFNIKNIGNLNFKTPQALLYKGEIEETDEWFMIFAPYGGQGYGKIQHPDPTRLTFIKLNNNGAVLERFEFNSQCNLWAINESQYVGGSLYLYGMGEIKNPDKKYTAQPYALTTDVYSTFYEDGMLENIRENMKYTHLQVVKITGNKTDFVSAASIDEINAVGIKPLSQKKLRAFDGKKFILNGFDITSSGDIFISGQNFSLDAVGQTRGRVYKDLFLFHFGNDGRLRRYYGVQNTAKPAGLIGGAGGAKSFPNEFVISESPDGKNLYWTVLLVSDIDVDCSKSESVNLGGKTKTVTTTCAYTPLFKGRMGKIDIESGSIDDFIEFGGKDFYLYIDLEDNGRGKDLPYFTINGGKELVYVARQRKGGISGNDRWGSSLWFGKLQP